MQITSPPKTRQRRQPRTSIRRPTHRTSRDKSTLHLPLSNFRHNPPIAHPGPTTSSPIAVYYLTVFGPAAGPQSVPIVVHTTGLNLTYNAKTHRPPPPPQPPSQPPRQSHPRLTWGSSHINIEYHSVPFIWLRCAIQTYPMLPFLTVSIRHGAAD